MDIGDEIMDAKKNELYQNIELFPDKFMSVKNSILYSSGYWYPLERKFPPEYKAVVYDLDSIYRNKQIGALVKVFEYAGISSVKGFHPFWNEGQPTWRDIPDIKIFLYEKDEHAYNFNWIVEEYYYDSGEEWIVYVSHEGTITLCGDKLAPIAEKLIPVDFVYNMVK